MFFVAKDIDNPVAKDMGDPVAMVMTLVVLLEALILYPDVF